MAGLALSSTGTTLRRQLLWWLSGPLLSLWLISSVIDYDIANRFVNLAYDRALLESALDIGRQVKVLNERVYVDLPEIAVQMLQTRESGRVYYLVTGPDSEFITGEPDLPPPPDPLSGRINYYDQQYRGRPVRIVALQLPLELKKQRGLVMVQVAENRAARNEFARQILLGMVLPQALLILLAGMLVWHVVGRALAPLSSLREEIESRSHRDLSALPEHDVPQEVRPLVRAMNELLGRLSTTLSSQQRFIADAAHQLRTPIAGLKTQTELAMRQAPSGEAQATLKQLRTATEQTTRLVNQLLSLARAEPAIGGRTRKAEPIDLVALAREAASDWVPRALTRHVDLGFDDPGRRAYILGDAFQLREMLNNLLDNAIRYTGPGGQVGVRVSFEEDDPVLCVEDNGQGIPEAERARVFERFYRVLGTGVDGCGLGLAIVDEIAQQHGAQVTLASGADGRGTLVRVVFRRAVAPAVASPSAASLRR
ncbi:MAG TPA: sensor histidine kinase N-terminal domain-containing protein [Burkholderiales bacterium]